MQKLYNNQIDVCTECGGKIILHNGEYKCSECGLVYGIEVKCVTTWNRKTKTNKRITYDAVNPLLSKTALGSYIGLYNQKHFYDSLGNLLPGRQQKKFQRLKFIYETTLMGNIKKSEDKPILILNRVISLLGITKEIRDRAVYIYRSILNNVEYSYQFRSYVRLIAACLLIAYRERKIKIPFSLKSLLEIFNSLGYNFSAKKVLSDVSKITRLLGIKFYTMRSESYFESMIFKLKTKKAFLSKLISNNIATDLYFSLLRKIGMALYKMTEGLRGGRNPHIFAAAIIYAAERKLAKLQERSILLTQRETGKLLGIASHSIRDHFSFLRPFLDKIKIVELCSEKNDNK